MLGRHPSSRWLWAPYITTNGIVVFPMITAVSLSWNDSSSLHASPLRSTLSHRLRMASGDHVWLTTDMITERSILGRSRPWKGLFREVLRVPPAAVARFRFLKSLAHIGVHALV